ncbi:MAG TPA: type II toxin-antitoxin system RelE/ParE family toxin [Bacteroidales bacterium]|nr:type II toxin-antitoxin system RelE/ParE family toxin [Bacteroidales bacterium]
MGVQEIRVQTGSDICRIFCFFDEGQLVVIANGFQKKSQRKPKQEIELALKIKEAWEGDSLKRYNNNKCNIGCWASYKKNIVHLN